MAGFWAVKATLQSGKQIGSAIGQTKQNHETEETVRKPESIRVVDDF